jgi:uncharacterized membrane protein YjgN (DUF898 family)
MQQTYVPPAPGALSSSPSITFKGSGGDYFGIVIVNLLLTIVTLGLYYPWAKARQLQYLYGNTEMEESRFAFHGTGKEMFKGFIKAFVYLVLIYGTLTVSIRMGHPVIGLVVFYIGFLAILPFAIHGANRYRWSRTSWRGIRFGYRGNRSEFVVLFFKNLFLAIITLGIYGAWMQMNLRNYILCNVRFGSASFQYKGDGWEYFKLNFKGYLATVFTLGIYMFWWQANIFRYYIDNLELTQDDKSYTLRSTATGGNFFGLIFVNLLIFVFTLGIGYSWIVTRTLSFVFEHVEILGNVDLNALAQTEEEYKDATGEDMADFLDLGFVI